MEVLSRLLRRLPTYPGFSYHPKCVQLHLTHLVFADDLLVFTRGDLPSIIVVASCMTGFAALTGLDTNPLKTNVYFGGVGEQLRSMIMDSTGFREGEFPFRYLGLPLSTSRFTVVMFKPVLDKIRAKIMHWANHSLSYAGKATLINSVIFGIQNFWGASILLPKGIIKNLQKICKDFFWGTAEGKRRIVFKGWTGESIWQAKSSISQSWFWKSVILIKDMLLQITGQSTADTLLARADQEGKLQMGLLFHIIRPRAPETGWYRTIHDTAVLLKHAVIGALACQNKLATIDNLKLRGIPLANRCVLCEQAEESINHLFFACTYSSQVFTVTTGSGVLGNPSKIAAPKLMKKLADIYFATVVAASDLNMTLIKFVSLMVRACIAGSVALLCLAVVGCCEL
ncbi:uncharacterized protein LOC141651818 [Silene latifolia]|uniref:uncharacterized protein LOC141651818 n=1 Tax=Silene latifolia TaxID=37657 RepID=UPI003D77B1AD